MSTNEQTETRETAVLDSRGEVAAAEESIAPRLDSFDRATVVLLDNSKANADVLLEAVGSALQAEYGVAERLEDEEPDSGGLARGHVRLAV